MNEFLSSEFDKLPKDFRALDVTNCKQQTKGGCSQATLAQEPVGGF
jgi:hypothetical protein